jgi:hypothetical protein
MFSKSPNSSFSGSALQLFKFLPESKKTAIVEAFVLRLVNNLRIMSSSLSF